MQLTYTSIPETHKASLPSRRESNVLQRSFVWTYLQRQFPDQPPKRILILNCGTGEDAMYLTRLGHKVVATEGDPKALKVAMRLAEESKYPERPIFLRGGLGSIYYDKILSTFDLILANFGVLNTLDPSSLTRLIDRFPRLLNPGGRVIAVVRPQGGLWQNAYTLFSNPKEPASQEEAEGHFRYYSPAELKSAFSSHFDLLAQQPIGFALPPSHMEERFVMRRKLIRSLKKWEKRLNQFPFLASMSDHYLVDFTLKDIDRDG